MTRPLRVLCLHGWRTNDQILAQQTSALRHAFGAKADFWYLNAPWTASGPAPAPIPSLYGHLGPFYQWWDAQSDQDRELICYEGLQDSLDHVISHIHALGKVDVLLGFSQGAAMATLLTAHYICHLGHVPWKTCVLIGGFYPRTRATKELLDAAKTSTDGAINLPSIHVIGQKDPLAPSSEKLCQSYTRNRRVKLEHGGGHTFPSSLYCKQLYSELVQEVLAMTGQAWT